jgi:hypothetical protein
MFKKLIDGVVEFWTGEKRSEHKVIEPVDPFAGIEMPELSGVECLLDDLLIKPLLDKQGLEKFILNVYLKHIKQYVEVNYTEIKKDDIKTLEENNVKAYVEQAMGDIEDSIDTYLGWIEQDIDDLMLSSIDNVVSVPKEVWDVDKGCEGCEECTVEPIKVNTKEKNEEKKENVKLVDWDEVDKAW